MTNEELSGTLADLFGQARWPKPVHVLQGVNLVRRGEETTLASRTVGASPVRLKAALAAGDPVAEILGLGLTQVDEHHRGRSAQMLGQLLVGRCAELAFEEMHRTEMQSQEFELRDIREGRTDTDYRLHNGQGRPVYRINIKFHGSPFRRAKELVDLEPEDCFALATYKIHSALLKQDQEGLPYFFAIVGVPNLTGAKVGEAIPARFVDTVALVDQAPRGKSKRDFEDAVVRHLETTDDGVFRGTLDRIRQADWYVISARRAVNLLRERLFARVYALRVRSFARAFRGAELDMHFSLSKDLIPLRRYLATLRDEGAHKVTTLLERGDF